MSDREKPAFEITYGGQKMPVDVKAAVMQLTVDEAVNSAALCTITLRDDGGRFSDGRRFAIGKELVVELGYVGDTEVVFQGEITAWGGEFPRRGRSTLKVIAMDRFHRLRRGRASNVWLAMKDSAIVDDAVKKSGAGLTVAADATDPVFDHVMQCNQRTADFILERAALYGFEVWVEDKKLRFRKPDLAGGPVATLTWHETLRHFAPTVSLARQIAEVSVTGWDMLEKKAIAESGKKGDERSPMGGVKKGAELVAQLFGGPIAQEARYPATKADQSRAFALGLFQRRSERFVTAEGSCKGEPAVRRGKVVKVLEIGEFLSGAYYVVRAQHTLVPAKGYTTSFSGVKTSVGTPKAPPPPPTPPPPPPPPGDLAFECSFGSPAGQPVKGLATVVLDEQDQEVQ